MSGTHIGGARRAQTRAERQFAALFPVAVFGRNIGQPHSTCGYYFKTADGIEYGIAGPLWPGNDRDMQTLANLYAGDYARISAFAASELSAA